MGLFQGHRGTQLAGAGQVVETRGAGEGFEDLFMRRESTEIFAARAVPVDPYAAWLQERKVEREREREQRAEVRWVHGVPAGSRGAREMREETVGAGVGSSAVTVGV